LKQPRQFRPIHGLARLALVISLSIVTAAAQENGEGKPIPSFRELEAAGAIIGEIRINNQNIFNLDDPKENNALFRLANQLHIRTRPDVVRRALLFNSGERLSVRLIEESERLLRGNGYLYDVRIQPVAYRDGVVDIEVTTRDTWTLSPGFHFSRQGGTNSTGITLREQNLLGTGIAIGVSSTSDVDRTGREYFISQNNAFGGWTTIEYRYGAFDDGDSNAFRLERPFYALDTRWAAGVAAATNRRIDSVYSGSEIVGQYRHASDQGDIYGGWSPGLVNGWAHRYSIGLQYQDDAYSTDPSLPAPPQVPADLTLVAPFLRYELIKDNFEKVKNRNLIERVEYFELGLHVQMQLGRATTALGSTRDLWLYTAAVSDGFALTPGDNLLVSAYANGRYGSEGGERQFYGTSGKYYREQRGRGLFFASVSADTIMNGEPADQFQLGGDSGLRGYPQRYQTGTNRVVLSLEQRGYTDWYPFRLFRIGGAVFYDYGRAWGGENQNAANPGWLSDIGIGLRILNDRTSRGGVLHIDLAYPLKADPDIKSYQFLVNWRTSF